VCNRVWRQENLHLVLNNKGNKMALHWNLSKIADYEKVCLNADGSVSAKTETIIWATMTVQLGKITESNYQEFFVRLDFGNRLRSWGYDLTEEDIKAHIGLTTNVIDEPWSKYQKHIMGLYMDAHRFAPKRKKVAR
jgi:hypothetical protein